MILKGKEFYSNGKAILDRDKEDSEECREHDKEVEFVDLPYLTGCRNIDKSNDCSDDNGAQNDVWSVLKEWHEEQKSHHNRDRHYYVGNCCFATCIVVHS